MCVLKLVFFSIVMSISNSCFKSFVQKIFLKVHTINFQKSIQWACSRGLNDKNDLMDHLKIYWISCCKGRFYMNTNFKSWGFSWKNLTIIDYFRQVKDILYVLDVINLSQGVYVFMIFILKRDVLQTCYKKYLKVRGRLPKKPLTSITDFLTNTRYVCRVYEYHKKSFHHLTTYFMSTWWVKLNYCS